MGLDIIKTSVYQSSAGQRPRIDSSAEVAAVDVNTTPATNNAIQSIQPLDQKSDNNEATPSDSYIRAEISKANNRLKVHNTRCEFSYHESTKRVSIKVMDRNTEEVIREIPPEETLEMLQKMWELAGFMVDERR